MTDRKTDPSHPNVTGNTVKDPEDWTTGNEPMTGAQRSYLKTLCDEANEPMDETLTKAQAAKRIDMLQQQTGRGMDAHQQPTPDAGSCVTPGRAATLGSGGRTTDDEPMTGAAALMKTLCDEANEPMDETLTKAQASNVLRAQQRTGRGARPSRPAAGPRVERPGMVHLLATSRTTDSLHGQWSESGKRTDARAMGTPCGVPQSLAGVREDGAGTLMVMALGGSGRAVNEANASVITPGPPLTQWQNNSRDTCPTSAYAGVMVAEVMSDGHVKLKVM